MILQEYWKNETIPGINGLTLLNGDVFLFKEQKCNEFYQYNLSTIDAEESSGELASLFDIYAEVRNQDVAGRVVCGECEMGNEGFIAYESNSGVLQWSIYSSFSNPFLDDLKVVNDIIVVSTEIQYHWSIPIYNPKKMSCKSKNEWNY